MVPKPLLLLLVCWLQWPLAAFGQGEPLEQMTASDRLAWVTWFVKTELNHLDSAAAFLETNRLLERAKVWNAPEIVAVVYAGQGDYLQQVCHLPENALRIYTKGFDFCNSKRLKQQSAGFLLCIAKSHWLSNDRITAYEKYLRAHELLSAMGFERVPELDQYEYEIGCFLYDVEDYENALEHLAIANLFPGRSLPVRHQVLLSMGKCYLKLKQVDNAMTCYQKCFQLAKQERNVGGMGSASIRIGQCHLLSQRYTEARFSLSIGSKWSEQANQPLAVAQASILLAELQQHRGNVHAAAEELKKAEALLLHAADPNLFTELCQRWMAVYEQLGNYREAYRYYQLQDSIRRLTDRNLRNPSNSVVRLEGRRRVLQYEQQQKAKRDDRQVLMLLASLLILLGAGIYINWKNQQRRKKDLTFAQLRAEQLEHALQQYADQQQEGINGSPQAAPPANSGPEPMTAEETAEEALMQILALNLRTDMDSRHLRKIVEKIHPGFFSRFPGLTQSEIRLLALTKLNLSTKEMAEILHIEPNSVRRLRNRIRQKYGLPAGDNFGKLLADK